MFPGDAGYPANGTSEKKMAQFAPRVGVVWTPSGDEKTSVRASWGVFYDTPHLFFNTRFANNPPWGAQITISNPPGGFADPDYVGSERDYKWNAHLRWEDTLSRDQFAELLAAGQHQDIARQAIAIESRTNLLFSFEKMALRDAVKSRAGAQAFAQGLFEFLHGEGGGVALQLHFAEQLRKGVAHANKDVKGRIGGSPRAASSIPTYAKGRAKRLSWIRTASST